MAKTLAYILGGGKLQSSSPKGERIVVSVPSDTPRDFFPDLALTPDGKLKFILPPGAQLKTIPPKTARGPFYVTVEERLPPHRPADPTNDRYWVAAEEVRKRVEGGEQFTKALKTVCAKYKSNINRVISFYRILDV
ncbi:hypothetical protein WOC76_04055 [Methylocystis sp. IM3]|uniref:hypothetical protein n=1 Tax=unclassified Methylocystis TaxID=2625913 RepID=UPI0030FB64C5